ncbi:hypothetical protein KQX54_013432 [Cotesia glomerata]|uniref:Uncharacterized protein n=1 Tax=Cotesia glomerata TaxID=32391 RepID=A0AAV7J3I6_COTGL|nr:hypothetical protein KQX54_013432 [Cotesia glomerata]
MLNPRCIAIWTPSTLFSGLVVYHCSSTMELYGHCDCGKLRSSVSDQSFSPLLGGVHYARVIVLYTEYSTGESIMIHAMVSNPADSSFVVACSYIYLQSRPTRKPPWALYERKAKTYQQKEEKEVRI